MQCRFGRTIVAQPTDESDATTLPDPELNPLLNPLLAAHMGRWAEVYFTNPPEKREQAVSELLRELANGSLPEALPVRPGEVPVQHNYDARMQENMHESVEDEPKQSQRESVPAPASFMPAEEPSLTCGSCGHDNLALQRFCGMCGRPLRGLLEQEARVAEAVPPATASWAEPDLRFEGGLNELLVQPDSDFAPAGHHQTTQSAPSPVREENLPAFGVRSQFRSEFIPESRSYRLYIGAAVAILAVLLIYMTWRGSSAFWTGVTAPAQLPRAVPAEQRASATLAQPNAQQNAALTSAPPASPVDSQNQRDAGAPRNTALDTRATSPIVPVTAISSMLTAGQGGFEELATAEKYLHARPGVAPDTQQGAQWLWKAVAKQNLTATLLLSDLYLLGDGVPKNCDQARVLLDAAAKKGVTAAAERLRNLQAFGCQ